MQDPLANYYALREKVDCISAQVSREFSTTLSCRQGCDSCCRHLSLYPVEMSAIIRRLGELPEERRAFILDRVAESAEESCPLLFEHVCLLYEVRPLICRTHGNPLIICDNGVERIDFCQLNFNGVTSFPGSSVLNLEQLNMLLTSINALFLKTTVDRDLPERIQLRKGLLSRAFPIEPIDAEKKEHLVP